LAEYEEDGAHSGAHGSLGEEANFHTAINDEDGEREGRRLAGNHENVYYSGGGFTTASAAVHKKRKSKGAIRGKGGARVKNQTLGNEGEENHGKE